MVGAVRNDPERMKAHKTKMTRKAQAAEARYQALRKSGPLKVMKAVDANQSRHGKIKKGLVREPKGYVAPNRWA